MDNNNAKNKTSGAWRDQESRRDSDDADSYSRIRFSSTTTGNQSLGVGRANWQGANLIDWSRGDTSGKILKQLIEETRRELAHYIDEAEKLRERLQGLELLDEQLMEKTKE